MNCRRWDWTLALGVSVAAHAGGLAAASLLPWLCHDRVASIELPRGDSSAVRVFVVAVGDAPEIGNPAEDSQFEAPMEVLEEIGITDAMPTPPTDSVEAPELAAAMPVSDSPVQVQPQLPPEVFNRLAEAVDAARREIAQLAESIRQRLDTVADQASRLRTAAVAHGSIAAPGATSSGILHGPVAASANKPPIYPDEARRRRQSGTVVLHFVIGDDGRVVEVAIAKSSGVDLLDRAAADAARSWHFSPAMENGEPIRSEADLPIEFVLK